MPSIANAQHSPTATTSATPHAGIGPPPAGRLLPGLWPSESPPRGGGGEGGGGEAGGGTGRGSDGVESERAGTQGGESGEGVGGKDGRGEQQNNGTKRGTATRSRG